MKSREQPTRFKDRVAAGQQLGRSLADLREEDPLVLALPRGGVPVAAQVASALHAPLDILLVRKLGLPSHPEVAFGAIGEDGVRILNEDVVQRFGLSEREILHVENREREELARRLVKYRGGRPPLSLEGRTVIIVDDGLATGATARVAVRIARRRGARHVIVAVPVASLGALRDIASQSEQTISLLVPQSFRAVGEWYEDFDQTTDEEVTTLLDAAAASSNDTSHLISPI
jgi:predicted phosphoribosyltransferase